MAAGDGPGVFFTGTFLWLLKGTNMSMSRRTMLKAVAAAAPAIYLGRVGHAATPATSPAVAPASMPANLPPKPTFAGTDKPRIIADGPFKPTWESLKEQYKVPDWFRDAKFGIWAHWSAQCVPESGDWCAREMYIQGNAKYNTHVQKYGHPSEFGFMEIDNLWKAEKWDPQALIEKYKKVGAKYFVALANHHDNFDNYDSTHHEWNSVRVGPKKDLIKGWAAAARAAGLRFGVTNHSAHSWHWFQTAYGYDATGPKAGVRYDAFRLRKEDGKGKWWEGLDPQALYNGPILVMPDGLTTTGAVNQYHQRNTGVWNENMPPNNPEFTARWYARCAELVDKYDPDLLYFDNTELPLGQAGLDIAAHFYNGNIKRRGKLEAILNAKHIKAPNVGALVQDYERGSSMGIQADPWQTDTCIGEWHYSRNVYTNNRYKTALQVVQMLIDITSKNGCLLLSVPLRADGTYDEKEAAVLDGIQSWMAANSEAIYATRPWKVYGEGPSTTNVARGQFGGAADVRRYATEDLRFTTKGNVLYVFAMGWPEARKLAIKSLAAKSENYPGDIGRIELLGSNDPLPFTRDGNATLVSLPEKAPNEYATVFKVLPKA
jgi:alpha-L-fucosidase